MLESQTFIYCLRIVLNIVKLVKLKELVMPVLVLLIEIKSLVNVMNNIMRIWWIIIAKVKIFFKFY